MSEYLLNNKGGGGGGGIKYGDNAIDHVNIAGYTYGGTNASIRFTVYDKEDNVLCSTAYLLYSSGVTHNVYFGTIHYGGPWTMVATKPCTDGVNDYEIGDVIRTWGYDTNPNFTLYHRTN